ncbi:hypothetical protein [Streptomyces beijiangensis]|uniref:hypothetical protein n=1 Tax=Streptomyces beijiangensis TaxID=163361 RepID=UPI003CD0A74B
MIAIGGAIGTGLFLGAGGNFAKAGPALAFAYAICGIFAFFVVRALGEMVVHRPCPASTRGSIRRGGSCARWPWRARRPASPHG